MNKEVTLDPIIPMQDFHIWTDINNLIQQGVQFLIGQMVTYLETSENDIIPREDLTEFYA